MAAAILSAPILHAAVWSAETGDLERLRTLALEEVNKVRTRHDLDPLVASETLSSAAQAHAEDMLEHEFYSHVSPEGETARDRYLEHGGSRWKKVAENIANCAGCPSVPDAGRVRAFQEGWMDSPGHRENILAEGLESFGFGIVGEDGRVYAVQTFAGPGVPPALGPDEEPVRVPDADQPAVAARIISRERARQGLEAVEPSPVLSRLADRLLPDDASSERLLNRSGNIFELLPPGSAAAWSQLEVSAAACSGCGKWATEADIRYFVDQWLNQSDSRTRLAAQNVSHIGFAMLANGEGRKIAVVVSGQSTD